MKSEPWKAVRNVTMYSCMGDYYGFTRNKIASIQRITIVEKAEAFHKLDPSNLSRAPSGEVSFEVSLGS
jgi:hypothetical protein